MTAIPKVQVRRRGDGKRILDRIARAVQGPRNVKVGFPSGTDSLVLTKAVVNEFGTSDGRIPERPFMRNAMRANRGAYGDMTARLAKDIVQGKRDMRSALSVLGIKAQGDIQKEIASGVPPPNAPSTVQRKGSSKTLVDTGELRQSVTHQIDE